MYPAEATVPVCRNKVIQLNRFLNLPLKQQVFLNIISISEESGLYLVGFFTIVCLGFFLS